MPTMNVLLATLLLSLPPRSSSFSPASRLPLAIHRAAAPSSADLLGRPTAIAGRPAAASSPSALLAAKKRRRRKAAPSAPTTDQSDELPDFDFDDEMPAEATAVVVAPAAAKKETVVAPPPLPAGTAPATVIRRGAGLDAQLAEEVGGNVDGLDQDTILEAMRGKAGGDSWQPPRSIQDTLADRRLEKFMDFDKMIEKDGGGEAVVDLPDFDEVISRRKKSEAATAVREGRVQDAAMLMDTDGMGKKAARNAQRRAAAMQREDEMEEEGKNPFEGVNALKLLENGAWVGIGLLVLWEFYINSPLFDRASPLIPVVYDTIPPGM